MYSASYLLCPHHIRFQCFIVQPSSSQQYTVFVIQVIWGALMSIENNSFIIIRDVRFCSVPSAIFMANDCSVELDGGEGAGGHCVHLIPHGTTRKRRSWNRNVQSEQHLRLAAASIPPSRYHHWYDKCWRHKPVTNAIHAARYLAEIEIQPLIYTIELVCV